MFYSWRRVRATSKPLKRSPDPRRKRKARSTGTPGSKPTVLVVDDDRLIADTTTEILLRSGFHAICAYDGRTGFEIAIETNPDFVITDVVMPAMNGVDLAIAIRNALPNTTIVLVSGQAGISDILERGREKGYSFELFAKPLHPEKLLERLEASRLGDRFGRP